MAYVPALTSTDGVTGILQSGRPCFVSFKTMLSVLGKDPRPHSLFSVPKTCKLLANFVTRMSNVFYSSKTVDDEVPGNELSFPGVLSQQEIDPEL